MLKFQVVVEVTPTAYGTEQDGPLTMQAAVNRVAEILSTDERCEGMAEYSVTAHRVVVVDDNDES